MEKIFGYAVKEYKGLIYLLHQEVIYMKTIAVVGSGFTGAVISHKLAHAGYNVDVFEERSHLAGNCHTERDKSTSIMLHSYGPHIFHTDHEDVWSFVNQFDDFMPFENRVKAVAAGRVYSLPINLLTINSFFNKTLSPREAAKFIESIADNTIDIPVSFEEQALKFVGRELYETFFKGYTIKQWGIDPKDLPASILKRLPVRFNYNDNYYNSKYQGMPKNGYTYIVEKLLNHENIKTYLNRKFSKCHREDYYHIFYSGPIDSWFDYEYGRLPYRTLDFKPEYYDGDYQGNAVVNYCDENVPWTRISEHKHFSPWETHQKTVVYKEYSREAGKEDIPYYPIRLLKDQILLDRYLEAANNERKVTFAGRLGTYRYLDMDATIKEALDLSEKFIVSETNGSDLPKFPFPA